MSIERISNPVGNKATGSDGHHAKTKGHAGGDASSTVPGDFLSFMSELEADAGTDSDSILLVTGGILPDMPVTPLLPDSSDPSLVLVGAKPVVEAGIPEEPADLSMLLASQSMVQGGVPGGTQSVAVSDVPASHGITRAATEVSRQGIASTSKLQAPQSGVKESPGLAGIQAQVDSVSSAGNLVAKPSPNVSAKSSISNVDSSKAATAPDWRDARMTQGVNVIDQAVARPEMVLPVAGGELGFRQQEKLSEKAVAKQVGGASDGAWGTQALFATARVETPTAVVNAALPSPEILVAEQVSYWASHDVQNAELKLDGFGKDAVEVSIALRGNEAHVAFRTDQAATRDLLEATVPHLEEMLKTEGLLLSGVSVGASGQQDGRGTQDRQPRFSENARQMRITVPDPVSTQSVSREVRNSGKTVDLFV